MKRIFIYQHMGMGDFILCNAIVREQAKKHERVILIVKPSLVNNVLYMYRDLNNLKVIALTDSDMRSFIYFNKNEHFLIIGHTYDYFYKLNNGIYETFDTGFYEMANIPIEHKWEKFYFERDLDKEKQTYYEKLGLKDEEEYLFVHDERSKGRIIRKEFIDKGIKIVRPNEHPDIGIFDFIYTIEKAKEVHVMNSSFSCLIDTMQVHNDNLYYHSYTRKDMGDNPDHKLKLNWNVIK